MTCDITGIMRPGLYKGQNNVINLDSSDGEEESQTAVGDIDAESPTCLQETMFEEYVTDNLRKAKKKAGVPDNAQMYYMVIKM